MRRVLLAIVSALLLPAGAEAACGVPAPRAEYETPDVQVYARKGLSTHGWLSQCAIVKKR